MNGGFPFTRFASEVLGVKLTAAQRVADAVAFDGVEPGSLLGEDRKLARQIFGDIARVPAAARGVVVRKKGARTGDTWRGAMRGLHLAVTHPLTSLAPGEPAYVVLVAPDQRLSRIGLQYVRGFVDKVPALRRLLESQTEDRIVLRRSDGSQVRFESLPATAGGSALRGRSLLLAVLDEAAFFKSGESFEVNDQELYRAVAPRVLPGGQVFIPSTPWIEAGLLHELFVANFGKPQTALAAHCPTLLMRDDEQTRSVVERERQRDPDNARREFDAEFGSGEEALLRGEDVDAAIMHGVESLPRDEGGRYVASGDLASGRAGRDFITFTVGHTEYAERPGAPPALMLVIDVARDWAKRGGLRRLIGADKVDLDEVERDFASSAKHYQCAIHLDGWGFDLFNQRMKQRGVRLVECSMAPGAQGKRAQLLVSYFTQRRIRLPDNEELVRQLKQFRVMRSSGGGLRFASLNRKGHHDDYPKSLMLLAEAAARVPASTLGGFEIEPSRIYQVGHQWASTPRQFFRVERGIRLSVGAPIGTREHEEQQRERLARRVCLQSDVDELGQARVDHLMGFAVDPTAPPAPKPKDAAAGWQPRENFAMSPEITAHLERRRGKF